MQTTTLTITGMRDEQCLRLVTNAIQDLPGIGYLEISLETGAATLHELVVATGAGLSAVAAALADLEAADRVVRRGPWYEVRCR